MVLSTEECEMSECVPRRNLGELAFSSIKVKLVILSVSEFWESVVAYSRVPKIENELRCLGSEWDVAMNDPFSINDVYMKHFVTPGVYCMKPRIREWSRDRAGYAKVRRLGFAIVPEFGGTIHGYCGETLDSNLLDLLEWHRQPTMEDMRKAYVGRSRTRRAEDMLLVQPYSPHLFRQGQMPGPAILMDVLRGKTTTSGAEHLWKKSQRQLDPKEGRVETKWLKRMPLPCRNCSDEDNQSTWFPLTHFSYAYSGETELWEKIAQQGQDLQCLSCKRKDFLLKNPFRKGGADKDTFFNTEPMMRCSKCRELLHHSKFDDEMKDNWVSVADDAPAVVCINCKRGHGKDKRQDVHKVHCDHCAQRGNDVPTDWPEGAFFTEDISNWRLHKTPLKCAACKLDAGEIETELLIQVCHTCEESVEFKGPPHGFSPTLIRRYLEGGKALHQGSRVYKDRWQCFNCQHPRCTTCNTRSELPGPSHTCYTKDGEYMCPSCRYPPCIICKKKGQA